MAFLGLPTACKPKNEPTFLSFNLCLSSSSGADADKVTSWARRGGSLLQLINDSGRGYYRFAGSFELRKRRDESTFVS